MSSITTNKSRWGYHACTYAEMLELKEYHNLLLRAYLQYLHWLTWKGKTVKLNGLKPSRYIKFVASTPYHTCWGFVRPVEQLRGPDLYFHILRQLRIARTPFHTPELIIPMELPVGWRDQSAELRIFFLGQ